MFLTVTGDGNSLQCSAANRIYAALLITRLEQAGTAGNTEGSSQHGLGFGAPTIDLDRLRAWKDSVVTSLTTGLGQLAARRNVQRLRGRGAFLEPDLIEVNMLDADWVRLRFRHCIVATGSRWS